MAKILGLLLVLCCLASTGCKDKYSEAMKRLVAEQKQYDWIDSKIKPIKERNDKESYEGTKREVDIIQAIAATGKTDPSETAKLQATLDQEGELRKQRSTEYAKEVSPWERQRTEQLKIIAELKKQVDAAR